MTIHHYVRLQPQQQQRARQSRICVIISRPGTMMWQAVWHPFVPVHSSGVQLIKCIIAQHGHGSMMDL